MADGFVMALLGLIWLSMPRDCSGLLIDIKNELHRINQRLERIERTLN